MHQLVLDLFPTDPTVTRRYTDDDDQVFVIKVQAAERSRPARPGPASVFDLAVVQMRPVKLSSEQRRRHSRVIEKVGGRVRIMVDERETPEWQEREYQRRARQVVPRPPKAVETKGEKLKQLIGEK